MKKIILLFCLLTAVTASYASEQVYFKIAVNENDYSTFLTDRISTKQKILQYLATKMRQPFFKPEQLNSKYYKVVESRGIKYFDVNVVQYDVRPIHNDRFRHLLMVDQRNGVVIRKEIYDTQGKLVFAFTSLEKHSQEPLPRAQKISKKPAEEVFKGYFLVHDKTLKDGTRHMSFTDGLNKFSVFRKKYDIELNTMERILYGNYVFRKSVGKELFTVVGTLPFTEMERLVENISNLEENK